jgi:hypothetical protein
MGTFALTVGGFKKKKKPNKNTGLYLQHMWFRLNNIKDFLKGWRWPNTSKGDRDWTVSLRTGETPLII